ncbi:MAG: SusD/RagB family nutrient-binding outer membrane lipoprotein [Flavobacterium sp.]|nr:MAG: SusD/RagB family nutrient-binding outer membrane lipoprotein [Flavobacterium sp.]
MKYFKITCLILLLFSTTGCKKWLDINSDPASPQTSKAEFYLAPIIAQMAICATTDYNGVQFKLTQNIGAQTANDTFERQGFAATDVGGTLWRFVYINAGLNLEDMIKKAESVQNNTLAGVGYAIKAWGFQMLTDSHGPVILDEAFKDQLTFKYQDQPEVYAKVREWCQLALVRLNTPDVGDYSQVLKANDFLFGNTIGTDLTTYKARWRKFIYAILAQQYSHLTNKPQFVTNYADSVVKYVDLSFASAAEDAMISFAGASSANASTLSVNGGYLGSNRIGQPIVNYLSGGVRGTPQTNPTAATAVDPRITRMINPMVTTVAATNGVYRGVAVTVGDIPAVKTIPSPYGSAVPTVANPYPGKYLFGVGLATTDSPKFPLFSYSQLQFAKAEALFLKGNLGGAHTAYINGIRGHFAFTNLYGLNGTTKAPAITAAEENTYIASSEVAQNAGALTIADIMGQKYIAQWGWAGQEQFCDMRKYRYNPNVFRQFKPLEPAQFFLQSTGSTAGNRYVYRIRPRYNSEYIWNREALNEFGGLSDLYAYQETWFTLPN